MCWMSFVSIDADRRGGGGDRVQPWLAPKVTQIDRGLTDEDDEVLFWTVHVLVRQFLDSLATNQLLCRRWGR